jgi:uncharacterized protein (TIGR03790 family)
MLAALAAAASGARALTPAEVMILVNKDAPVSSQVANTYSQMRGIPQSNILRLSLGPARQITRDRYRTVIVPAVKKYLTDHPAIRCAVTTSGFPYTIEGTAGNQDGAALDNELAAVLRGEPKDWNGWQPNPLYLHGQNPDGVTDPRVLQMIYVARLDGPDLKTIDRMVADAITAEEKGLEGPVFGDSQGLDGNLDYAAADHSIRAAIDRFAAAGFPSTLDLDRASWHQPDSGVGSQAAGAAFYVGWYDLGNFQNIFGAQGLARGAIAWHIASGEAVNLWDPSSKEWCINLLRHGAAVTLGPVFEPYAAAFPKAEVMAEQLLQGKSIAESYWLALPHVSWAMVLLGDPLYRPFAARPRPTLVARAYVSTAPGHLLQAGRSGSLLVQLECVGPAGSQTPELTASAEPGKGLAAASGKISIPSLTAGQSAVVRIPAVTAGSQPAAMFRLHLNAADADGNSRRIVLEGRAEFAQISGESGRQNLMFVSPKGTYVVSGNPDRMSITDTATLHKKALAAPAGWGILNAAFSPDESHMVLTLADQELKHAACFLAGAKLRAPIPLPAGSRFLGWLSNDTLLLKTSHEFVEHNIRTGLSVPVTAPEGWTISNIIRGSNILILSNQGRVAVKDGPAALREVLQGAKVVRDIAIADDLSLFGGIDEQNRLWVQHRSEPPEVIAEHVEHAAWGPISRRLLVQTSDGQSRIYDGRDRSWLPLGPVWIGQWSPDETRFLYVDGERQNNVLRPRLLDLVTGRQVRQICEYWRIGDLAAIAIPAGGDSAFLLAGPTGALQVWMIALPENTASAVR